MVDETLLVDVPNLDALVAAPATAAALSPEVARTLLYGLAGLLPVLIARSSQPDRLASQVAGQVERFLTVEQVIAQYGVTESWLYRHKRQLPHSQPSRKVLLFPEGKLQRWFASRKTG